ncbi:hypothetical protein A3A03_03520 [Candidatus Nomurabacteria bacterium RIFCSPLOWO2_01_FULL_40_18]|uniref:Baseplate protein J-like domain-containing protein n=1 Tax=Candidatus Nomurabacteria bacterium RIFCSPLOWO2_01_FULL_40_18 TaxID=1801773 RepID=A0A1F6XK86_9BACT|nr:MAG: hypothetical protein A3A03_03520 [Candidatus Nomurabacteria bacterium RIFCSPLOWO2_01_FULL_40_18]
MPKNLFQDMVRVKRASREIQAPPKQEIELEPIRPRIDPPQEITKPRKRYTLWLVAIISLLFFLVAISYLFLNATIVVNPRMQDLSLNENLFSIKGAGSEALPFDLIILSGEENQTVSVGEKKDVSERSKGVVLIYNAFSSVTQRLDIDTRLEGSNGKIYKTEKQIVVPSMKGNTPGSTLVGIYATEAGEEYNSGPLDFTIVGFKGTPKYSKFYARSKGDITGGFKGQASIISEAQKSEVIDSLKTTLQAKLLQKATDQIPDGFILFKDAVFLDVDESSINLFSTATSSNNVLPITLKGTLYGVLFDETKLTKKIAESKISKYDGSAIFIPNIRDLSFSFLIPKVNSVEAGFQEAFSFKDLQAINFNLSGTAKIVYRLDEAKFATDLLGKSKKDFKQILSQYPNIDSADLSINPFWKTTLPDKAKDIKVIVNYPK